MFFAATFSESSVKLVIANMETTVEIMPRRVVEYCRDDTLPDGNVETNILSTTMFIVERLEENIKGNASLNV